MSQTVKLEVSDQLYAELKQEADEGAISFEAAVLARLANPNGQGNGVRSRKDNRTEAEKQAARERFESHFGEIDLGYAIAADNETLDAILAQEYLNNHENE